jgi:hypothetical protein
MQLFAGVTIPSDSHGSFDHSSMSGLRTVVLQTTEGIDERRLARSKTAK